MNAKYDEMFILAGDVYSVMDITNEVTNLQ